MFWPSSAQSKMLENETLVPVSIKKPLKASPNMLSRNGPNEVLKIYDSLTSSKSFGKPTFPSPSSFKLVKDVLDKPLANISAAFKTS